MRNFTIGGTTALVNDWKLSKARDTRAIFECQVLDYEPEVDEEVIFNDGLEYFTTADEVMFRTADGLPFITAGLPVFKGLIMTSSPYRDGLSIFYDISAVDYSAITDNRITSFVAYNKTVADIITDHLLTILTEEGITLGTIDTGATLVKCVFPFKSISYILDTLASVSGDYYWTIDSDKALHFQERSNRVTTIEIDSASVIAGLKYETESGDYRNTQIVIGSSTPTAPQTETLDVVVDGNTYETRYPLNQQPQIFVGETEQTSIGVNGLDTGTDWSWSYQSKTITYNGVTPPAQIVITYTGLYPVIAKTKNQSEINRKKALSGGSGIRENLHNDSNINDSGQARQVSTSLLQRYAKDGETITFNTESIDYSVGDIISVVRSEMGINGLYEVLKIDARAIDADSIEYSVTLTNGTAATWDRFFAKLVEKSKTVSIGDDAIATTLKDSDETMTVAGEYWIGYQESVLPATDLYPSDALIPNPMTEVTTIND